MDILGLTFTILGIVLLGVEGLGKKRADRLERGFFQFAKKARYLFGSIVLLIQQLITHPKEQMIVYKVMQRKPPLIPNWGIILFLGFSLASLIIIAPRAENTIVLNGQSFYFGVIGLASYIGLLISLPLTWLPFLVVKHIKYRKTATIFLAVLSPICAIYVVAVCLFAFVSFVGTMAFSFPAIIIFAFYVLLWGIFYALCTLIEWKNSMNAGNIFIIFGMLFSITGAIMLYFT